MTILTANDLRHNYGIREVLSGTSMAVDERERIGLVGRNGSGKTTLVRILAGELDPDEGEIVKRNGLRVGYLAQEPRFDPELTAVEAVLGGLQQWQQAMQRYDEVSRKLETGTGKVESLLRAQADAGAEVEKLGGWEKRHEAAEVLGHVGVVNIDTPMGPMSGGERRRVALARVLVAAPDLAILDEPTNHLDLDAVEWLERWLVERFTGALILVTHDRYLLDRVVGRTLEVEDGLVHSYEGGWCMYLEARAERDAQAARVDANRRNFLRREIEWLRRTPMARTTKQKARIQRAEEAIEVGVRGVDKDATIEFAHTRSGKTILEADDVAVDVPGRRLIEDFTIRLSEGERIGIVGPNGCGKTSLLRVLLGECEPAEGTVTMGKNTKVAYLDQQRGGLIDGATIFDNVAQGRARIEFAGQTLEIRAYLERFLFDSERQREQVNNLSGGERARVALARTLRDQANVVVLDEPTNDLDVTTLGTLESSLVEYPGTLLVVTHDRWFLDRVATSVLAFEDGRITQYQGGYTAYLARRKAERAEKLAIEKLAAQELAAREKSARANAANDPCAGKAPAKSGLTFTEAHELEGLLERVEASEQVVADMEAEVAEAVFFSRPKTEQRDFFAKLEVRKAEAEALAQRWTALEEKK